MQIITEADFRRQIKNQIAPGYLFYGDEDYLKTHAAATLRGMICPDESLAVFNYYKVTPLDYNPDTLLAAMSSPPMMGDRKLIELCGFDLTKMRAEDQAVFFDVLSALPDYDYKTLVLSIPEGGIDEGRPPKKLSATFEKLSEYLIPVKFEKCSPQKLAMWAARPFEHNGVVASPAVCAKTVEYCGRDMYKLAGEIDKISFYVRSKGRTEVSEGDIVLVATPDSDYDAFAFANALTSGNSAKALEILSLMKSRRIEPVVIMGEVNSTFCNLMMVKALSEDGMGAAEISAATKLHSYRAGLYLNAVRDVAYATISRIIDRGTAADAAVKLGRGSEAIELFICSI